MRVFNRIAGYSEDYLRKTKNPPVSLARKHFPRPMKEELLSAMSNSSFTSFLIARYKIQFKNHKNQIYHEIFCELLVQAPLPEVRLCLQGQDCQCVQGKAEGRQGGLELQKIPPLLHFRDPTTTSWVGR